MRGTTGWSIIMLNTSSFSTMRIAQLTIFLIIGQCTFGQNVNDPFVGGIELSLGISTAIDFENFENAISYLPFQIGIVTSKYTPNNGEVEFGILYAKHSSKYRKLVLNNGESPVLTPNCIDIPIKYYSHSTRVLKRYYPFVGIVTSWQFLPAGIGDDGPEITEDSYRNIFLSICSGLYMQKNRSRFKLQLACAITSVIRKDFELDGICNSQKCGGSFYPIELLFSYAYIVK